VESFRYFLPGHYTDLPNSANIYTLSVFMLKKRSKMSVVSVTAGVA